MVRMKESETTVAARFDEKTVERIDRHRERLVAPGTKPTRSDALRNLVEKGLNEAERRSGVTRGETSSSTPKTRRGE
jgi:hypothetical protein